MYVWVMYASMHVVCSMYVQYATDNIYWNGTPYSNSCGGSFSKEKKVCGFPLSCI